MKYAHLESERRFLLAGLPDLPVARTLRITDAPVDYVREVTTGIRFSGGELAQVDGHGPVV